MHEKELPVIVHELDAVPSDLEISQFVNGANFADCFVAPNPWPNSCAMDTFLRTVGSPPGWVTALMHLRNRIVRLLGLKNLGALHEMKANKAATDYRVGERAGIFEVLYLSADEVVLGDHDKHLEVRVSVSKRLGLNGDAQIAVTTAVHEHNLLGRVYMLFVGPIHKLVVPAVLRRGLKNAAV